MIVEVISQFIELETFWLGLEMNFIRPSKETRTEDWETDSQEKSLLVATQFMTANPKLCRVSFPVRSSWVRGCHPCYVRASLSTTKFEGLGVLHGSSWREL